MKKCKECQHDISELATSCPKCGAPNSAPGKKGDWGFEYKDKTTIFGLPLIHVSFKYRANGTPVPAIGIISIGQFGMGVINISQIGVGVISVSQITVGVYALAQIAVAYDLIAQVGLYINSGSGQKVWSIIELINSIPFL